MRGVENVSRVYFMLLIKIQKKYCCYQRVGRLLQYCFMTHGSRARISSPSNPFQTFPLLDKASAVLRATEKYCTCSGMCPKTCTLGFWFLQVSWIYHLGLGKDKVDELQSPARIVDPWLLMRNHLLFLQTRDWILLSSRSTGLKEKILVLVSKNETWIQISQWNKLYYLKKKLEIKSPFSENINPVVSTK